VIFIFPGHVTGLLYRMESPVSGGPSLRYLVTMWDSGMEMEFHENQVFSSIKKAKQSPEIVDGDYGAYVNSCIGPGWTPPCGVETPPLM
jgi:hypothetical protein